MSEKPRLLIGGEQLAGKVIVKTSGQPKNPPYSFEEGRRRISANLNQVVSAVYELPDAACPNEETVAVLTVHPRYVSKSDQPAKLLKHVGLRALGSRPAKVTPDNWGIKKHPDEAISEELFVAGKREAIKKWSSELKVWTPNTPGAETIQTLEKVTEFAASQKIKGRPSDGEEAVYEVVLQGIAPFIIDAFEEYSISLGYQPQMDRLRRVRGLGFLPMRGDNKSLSKLAAFSFLRVVRGMPSLRPQRPRLIRSSGPTHFPVTLPDSQTTFGGHAVTFDGGLSEEAADALKPWVTLVEPADLGPPSTDFQQHGLYVSSSLLFGHFDQSQPVLHQPFASHDHVRVLDVKSPENDDCHEVLDRILNVLNTPGNSYDLINLSIGPELAVDDDEVTVWTASIDDQIAKKAALVTVACGNNGELDAAAGLNRVQAPADAVNVLSVGSADSQGDEWQRAPYSSVGPGRSPGLVKPDGLAFGGTRSSGFNVISSANTAIAEEGTSFAAPSVLRTACGIRAMVEDELDPLTLRALLIEGAECSKAHTSKHVGWGRFPDDPKRIIEGLETQATIVFRGTLPVGEHLRAPLPIPIELEGMVTVSATLVIFS